MCIYVSEVHVENVSSSEHFKESHNMTSIVIVTAHDVPNSNPRLRDGRTEQSRRMERAHTVLQQPR